VGQGALMTVYDHFGDSAALITPWRLVSSPPGGRSRRCELAGRGLCIIQQLV